jgi:hypothetical protein
VAQLSSADFFALVFMVNRFFQFFRTYALTAPKKESTLRQVPSSLN